MKSKKTRNRLKEKKLQSRAGDRPGCSSAKISESRRPSLTVAEERRDRLEVFGTDVAPSGNRLPALHGVWRRELLKSHSDLGEKDRRRTKYAQSVALSAAALATRLGTRTEKSNACASKEKRHYEKPQCEAKASKQEAAERESPLNFVRARTDRPQQVSEASCLWPITNNADKVNEQCRQGKSAKLIRNFGKMIGFQNTH